MAYRTVTAFLLFHVLSTGLFCQAPDSGTAKDSPAAHQDDNRGGATSSTPASSPSSQQIQAQPLPNELQSQAANIIGTITAENGDVVAGATIVLEGSAPEDRRTVTANDKGFFELHDLKPGIPYRVTVRDKGFADWISPALTLNPGQYLILTGCKLKIAEVRTTVNVGYASEQIATEQVKIEEQQRVFGVIPNFYVVYGQNAEPLTAKLKFKLALKTSVDPVTFIGVGFIAGINQAADHPDYGQGAKAYGQRFGSAYADGFSDILIGGAILPSLLHQDPRYFYRGTGTTKSRALYAMSRAFICKGDNGKRQPNYSTMGGDLAASAIAMSYYPDTNRSAGVVFANFLIDTASRMAANLAQELIFPKLTSRGKKKHK